MGTEARFGGAMTSDRKPPSHYDEALRFELIRRRGLSGMSLEKLADVTGISVAQLRRYEAGTNKVSVSRMMQLSHGLGARPAELMAEIDGYPAEIVSMAGFVEFITTEDGAELMAALPALSRGAHLGLLAKLATALTGKPEAGAKI